MTDTVIKIGVTAFVLIIVSLVVLGIVGFFGEKTWSPVMTSGDTVCLDIPQGEAGGTEVLEAPPASMAPVIIHEPIGPPPSDFHQPASAPMTGIEAVSGTLNGISAVNRDGILYFPPVIENPAEIKYVPAQITYVSAEIPTYEAVLPKYEIVSPTYEAVAIDGVPVGTTYEAVAINGVPVGSQGVSAAPNQEVSALPNQGYAVQGSTVQAAPNQGYAVQGSTVQAAPNQGSSSSAVSVSRSSSSAVSVSRSSSSAVSVSRSSSSVSRK